ncbi:MAG TPA: ATP-binding protein [Pirellulales bacterium]|nr:ATP-binding protein [Pirellulales bacterium]
MSDERWTWKTEQVIPSETGAGQRLLDDLLTQLAEHQWSEHEVHSVHLALEEALVNAIRHGNRSDPSKRVHVLCKLAPERLWVEIRDEGAGFNPDDVPDCTDPERLEIPSGRGIMLMRAFMSRVEYNELGNCVVMEKQRVQRAAT